MIPLITAILAALTGMAPGVLQLFTLKAQNAQQLAIEQLKLDAAKQGAALQIDLANSQADIQQQQHIYEFAGGASGYKFVDALAVFIRPFVTLVMFVFWLLLELGLFVYAVNKGFDAAQLKTMLWDTDTASIFAAIIGFWFGNKMLNRGQQSVAATIALTSPKTTIAPAPAPIAQPAAAGGVIPKPPGSRD